MRKKYIITTFDNKEYQIDEEDGMDLIEAWKGSEQSFLVDLGSSAINSASIKSIEPRQYTEVDMPQYSHFPQIQAGPKCHGQYSIQREINNIAKTHKDWAKRIQDKKWRDKTRQELRKQTTKWCDYKASTCYCE